jgi:hypothetical protein
LGPFRIFPSLTLTNFGYDNNVYRQPEDRNRVADFTFTTGLPLVTHLLLRERWILSFNFVPEYVYFVQEQRERSFNYTLQPSFRWLVLNRFVISGSYLHRRARIRTTSEFDYRTLETRDEARGQFFYEMAGKTTIGFTAIYRDLRYDDIDQPGQDFRYSILMSRTEKTGQGELYYQLRSDTQFFVNVGFGDIAFVHPDTKWKDSYVYYTYAGLNFPLLQRLRGTLSLGFKILEPYRAKKKGFEGIVGNTRIEYDLRRLVFRVLYERNSEFSYWTDNIFFIEDRYGLGASFYMNQYIRLDYDFSYRDTFYPEAQRIRMPDESYQNINRSDQYLNHTAGFVIRIFRSMGIGVQAVYWKRISNIRLWDRNQLFLGGYLTYQF